MRNRIHQHLYDGLQTALRGGRPVSTEFELYLNRHLSDVIGQRGGSQNFHRLAVGTMAAILLWRGGRRLRGDHRIYRKTVNECISAQHVYNRERGLHGQEAGGSYNSWNSISDFVMWLYTLDPRAEEAVRCSLAYWSLTAKRRWDWYRPVKDAFKDHEFFRHYKQRLGRRIETSAGGFPVGLRMLPWSWPGTEVNQFFSWLSGQAGIAERMSWRRESKRGLLEPLWQMLRELERCDDNRWAAVQSLRRQASQHLHLAPFNGNRIREFAPELRIHVPVRILRSTNVVLAWKEQLGGSNTAGPAVTYNRGTSLRDCQACYPYLQDRARNLRGPFEIDMRIGIDHFEVTARHERTAHLTAAIPERLDWVIDLDRTQFTVGHPAYTNP